VKNCRNWRFDYRLIAAKASYLLLNLLISKL
jgi:hypothetical protein